MKLQEDLKKKIEIITKSQSRFGDVSPCDQDAEPRRIPNTQSDMATIRLLDHLFSQPSLMKAAGIEEDSFDQMIF